MKVFVHIAGIIVGVVCFSSCQKVIDLKLNDAGPKYVIEGSVSDFPGSCRVKITQTKNFNENNTFPGVDSAFVSISDGGIPIVLPETRPGVYESSTFSGTIGHTYTLTVKIGDTVYTAMSTIPPLVPFDSLYIEESSLFGDAKKIANIQFDDPPGNGNAYHFLEYKNSVAINTVFVMNDEYTDGRTMNTMLRSFGDDDDDDIKRGDTIKVIMECVDADVYTYWSSLNAADGSSSTATPANPVSNISGGALGYFSAHTTEVKSIVVP